MLLDNLLRRLWYEAENAIAISLSIEQNLFKIKASGPDEQSLGSTERRRGSADCLLASASNPNDESNVVGQCRALPQNVGERRPLQEH